MPRPGPRRGGTGCTPERGPSSAGVLTSERPKIVSRRYLVGLSHRQGTEQVGRLQGLHGFDPEQEFVHLQVTGKHPVFVVDLGRPQEVAAAVVGDGGMTRFRIMPSSPSRKHVDQLGRVVTPGRDVDAQPADRAQVQGRIPVPPDGV